MRAFIFIMFASGMAALIGREIPFSRPVSALHKQVSDGSLLALGIIALVIVSDEEIMTRIADIRSGKEPL